jgi:uncharacterized protein (DUF305 family)
MRGKIHPAYVGVNTGTGLSYRGLMLRLVLPRRVLAVPLALAFAVGGCARGGDTASSDTAARTADTSGQVGAQPAPARDADQEFLRKMADHHEGLIQMASQAMTKASSPTTQSDAHQLHQKQQQEIDRMLGMLRSAYGETYTPTVMSEHRAMIDSLQRESGTKYDRDFYGDLIIHHREALQMVDQFLPRLTRPDLRQMAEKMKADQTREIREFERKQSRL